MFLFGYGVFMNFCFVKLKWKCILKLSQQVVSFLDDIEGHSLNNYVVKDYCLLAKSHLGQLFNDLNIVDDNYSHNNVFKK